MLRTLEVGIELKGSEIKSIRAGNVNLKDSFVKINYQQEVYVHNLHISHYQMAHSIEKLDERRARKLLLHRKEITKLQSEIKEKGLTIVPTKMYFKGQLIKLEIGLARGKKNYDKRASLKERDLKRSMEKIQKAYQWLFLQKLNFSLKAMNL
ncbi:MAG: SsrA-binding protein SmpB [Mycoplasmatales bacterium]